MQGVVSQKEQPEAFAALRGLTQESSVIVTGQIRAEPRAPGGFEMGVTRVEVVQRVPEIRALSDPAQRARRRFPAGPPASVDSHAAPGVDPAHSRRGHSRRARIHGLAGLHAHRRAHLHAGRLRRHHHAVRSAVHRRRESLPDAVGPALRRSDGRGAGQGLHASARRFAPRNRRRAATSPNSGCSSRRPPTRTWKT